MIRLRDHLFHPFHILDLRLEETSKVVVHGGFYRSRPAAEMATEATTKAKESLTNSCQLPHLVVGSSVFLSSSAVVPIMFHLAVPCLLIKRVVFLLIYKNQSDKSDKVELDGARSPGGSCSGRPTSVPRPD